MSSRASRMSRPAVALVWSIVVAVGSASVATADPTGTVTIDGDVHNPSGLTLDALRALPSHTQSVTFETSTGPQSHVYVGAALTDIVTAAGPDVDMAAKHPLLPVSILATGADGYHAAVSWGEISPELGATAVLVAYSEDGASLDQPRLVVPGDIEGSRYVSELTELRILDLARPH